MSKLHREASSTGPREELSGDQLRMLAEHGDTPFIKSLAWVLLYKKKEKLDRLKTVIEDSGGGTP